MSNPFGPILEKSRNLMCERLEDAIADMLDGAKDVLTSLIVETVNRDERCLYEEAREVATKQRETLEEHFRKHYVADFQRRSEQAMRIGQPRKGADYSLQELELVAEEDLEETLRFNDMAGKLRAYCDDELTALDQRVGVLLGDANLQTKDNPFSPHAICDAFKLACRHLDADLKVRKVLLKLFDDHVLDDIRSVYKAVNALLVRNSILPQIRYSIARAPEGGEATPHAVAPGHAVGQMPFGSPTAQIAAGAAQDLFSVLQHLVASNVVNVSQARTGASTSGASGGGGGIVGQGTALGSGGQVLDVSIPLLPGTCDAQDGDIAVGGEAPSPVGPSVLQGAELLSALTRIQRGDLAGIEGGSFATVSPQAQADGAAGVLVSANVLRDLKASSVGTGMGQMDAMTLDIVAMLFDVLFDDPKVPTGVKGLIGRLQIPVLKVAIADKSFFSTKAHPARQFLDAVGDIALRLPADFGDANPLFSKMEAIIQELVDGFHDSQEIFTTVRQHLIDLMAEEDKRIEALTEVETKRVEQLESLSFSRSVAQMEIQARVQARDVPAPVNEFLGQQWIKLLLLLHVQEGIESEPWKDALDTVDELLWSIEPKLNLEERRKLAATVPKLVKRLTAGLKQAGIDDDVRVQFFSELMNYHTQAISAAAPNGLQTSAVSVSNERAVASASAVPTGQAAVGDVGAANAPTLDFTAPLTVQNPFGGGEVKVDSLDLDFTSEAAVGARARREASVRRALENLEMGQWVEFRDPDDESIRRAGRLIFVSPRKTRYLFATDRAGKEIIQCSRAEITRRLRVGEAVKLDDPPEEPLFDRIMSGLLSKLRLPTRAMLVSQ